MQRVAWYARSAPLAARVDPAYTVKSKRRNVGSTWLGFAPLPPLFFAVLGTMIVTYLALVEVVKRWFYRVSPM